MKSETIAYLKTARKLMEPLSEALERAQTARVLMAKAAEDSSLTGEGAEWLRREWQGVEVMPQPDCVTCENTRINADKVTLVVDKVLRENRA